MPTRARQGQPADNTGGAAKPSQGQAARRAQAKSAGGRSNFGSKARAILRDPRTRWALGALLLIALATAVGGWSGYRSAVRARQAAQVQQETQALAEQYQLGVQDLEAGNYEVARQRLEWVLNQDPDFPGAADRLVEIYAVLFATATPTPKPTVTGTPEPTATPDLRPVQDLFASAQASFNAGDWEAAINHIVSLRSADPNYQVTQVDRMLYIALRNRGVDRILRGADLVGGSYDLALAEHFGPLDADAAAARYWARTYMYGMAFWGADPQTALFYFQQVAAALPYLSDGTGWNARNRYREVLVQYGDQLAGLGDWCAAEEQYRLAASIRDDEALQSKIADAVEGCAPPTNTPEPTAIPTETPTPTVSATAPVTAPPTEPPATTEPTLPSPTATQQPPGTTDTPTAPPTTEPPRTEPPPATTEPPATEAPTEEPTATTEPTRGDAAPTEAPATQDATQSAAMTAAPGATQPRKTP